MRPVAAQTPRKAGSSAWSFAPGAGRRAASSVSGSVLALNHVEVIAEHAGGTAARILCSEAHYDGKDTERVRALMPLGQMGRRLSEIAASNVEHRSIDLYAWLAEVAR